MQIFYLERQWVILDSIRDYRSKVLLVVGTLDLSITGFVLNSSNIPSDNFQRAMVLMVIVVITLLGICLFFAVQKQYKHHLEKIWHLYSELGISKFSFQGQELGKHDEAKPFFMIGYVGILLIGVICFVAMYILPVQ